VGAKKSAAGGTRPPLDLAAVLGNGPLLTQPPGRFKSQSVEPPRRLPNWRPAGEVVDEIIDRIARCVP
jgi:hypothetical protein